MRSIYTIKTNSKQNETKKLIRNTWCIMYTSLILSLNLAINLSPTLYHSLPLCNYSLNVCASSHSLVSPNPSTLSLSLNLLKLTRSFTHYLYIPFLLRPTGLLYVCNSFNHTIPKSITYFYIYKYTTYICILYSVHSFVA